MAWHWVNKDGTGMISQQSAASAEELFENAGFGAVDVDKPLKGVIAMEIPDPLYTEGQRVRILVGRRIQSVKVYSRYFRAGTWRYMVQYPCEQGFKGWRNMTIHRDEKAIFVNQKPGPET